MLRLLVAASASKPIPPQLQNLGEWRRDALVAFPTDASDQGRRSGCVVSPSAGAPHRSAHACDQTSGRLGSAYRPGSYPAFGPRGADDASRIVGGGGRAPGETATGDGCQGLVAEGIDPGGGEGMAPNHKLTPSSWSSGWSECGFTDRQSCACAANGCHIG
jgi:hypothetical protein